MYLLAIALTTLVATSTPVTAEAGCGFPVYVEGLPDADFERITPTVCAVELFDGEAVAKTDDSAGSPVYTDGYADETFERIDRPTRTRE